MNPEAVKQRKREALLRLINHPATPEHERSAAQLALSRLNNSELVQAGIGKPISQSFKTIFKRNMKRHAE